jgi:hypothetical protein
MVVYAESSRVNLPLCVSVEQAQIGDEVLLVVARQIPVSRYNVRDRRIGQWRFDKPGLPDMR